MDSKDIRHIHVGTIAAHNANLGLGKPKHPLFSIQRFEDFPTILMEEPVKLTMDCYQITLKKNCENKIIYGQSEYDFDEGVLSFFAPNQVFVTKGEVGAPSGYLILIKPEYLIGYPLESKIRSYGFFDYSVNESLILSEDEEANIDNIFKQLETEMNRPIDALSQDVIISLLDLLLTYSDRFYTRQFITRKPRYNELVARFETNLEQLLTDEALAEKGLPNVVNIAGNLHLSPKYFSDLIKQHTGLTTQQHIHGKLIARAKEKLRSTNLSVAEIAYQLGFEHPQSFNKLFKSRMSMSPLAYRRDCLNLD